MLYLQAIDLNEFNKILNIMKGFQIFELEEYYRKYNQKPFFIKIHKNEFRIEFLMTPTELYQCYKNGANFTKGYNFPQQQILDQRFEDFLIEFYPAFAGLMVGRLNAPDFLIDISCDQEELKNPEIHESLLYRDVFKKIVGKHKKNYQDNSSPFFKNSKQALPTDTDNSIFVNKFREYSSTSNQKKWIKYFQQIVEEVSDEVKKQEEINLFDFFKRVGNKRLTAGIKLEHQFNYLKLNVKEVYPNLTHYFGALRGVDNFTTSLSELIPLDKSIDPRLPFHLIKSELLDKLDNIHFVEDSTGIIQYADTFLGGDEADNFRLVISKTATSFMAVIHYPELNNINKLNNFFEKLRPYFNTIFNFKLTNNTEKIEAFLQALGKFAYHSLRSLPFRLGTSACIEGMIRGIADAKNISLGQIVANTSDNIDDWKELPLDWKAFLSFTEDDYAQWFSKRAFVEIKMKGSVISHYFSEKEVDTGGPNFG